MHRTIRTSADVGRLARAARKSRGLTQMQVADALGVTQKWVSTVEGGKDTAPIGAVLRLLCWLGVTLTSTDEGAPAEEKQIGSDAQIVKVKGAPGTGAAGKPRITKVLQGHRSGTGRKRVLQYRAAHSRPPGKRAGPDGEDDR